MGIVLTILLLIVGGMIGWLVGARTSSSLRRSFPGWPGWLVTMISGLIPAMALLLFFWGIGWAIISRPPGVNEVDAGAMASLFFWFLGATLAPAALLGGLAGAMSIRRR